VPLRSANPSLASSVSGLIPALFKASPPAIRSPS
jgi:hypothetical protein